jgi:ribosome-associated toxin RatA of RatAB toxin-antitoxin module
MTGVKPQHSDRSQGVDSAVDAALADAANIALPNEAQPEGESDIVITTEKLAGRHRRIIATTQIPFHLEQVWQVLTDYDHLADFIPNLTESQRVPHPEGGIRLVQVGSQCFLNVKFCARVVLDMLEVFPKELKFSMVEGDFRQFEGRWLLEPLAQGQHPGTQLCYELLVSPPRAMPAGLIERHIRRDLSQNLKAIHARTGLVFG